MAFEYQNIEADLNKLEIELRDHYPINENEEEEKQKEGIIELDKFSATMHQFYKEASTEFKRVCMLSSKMDESYDQVVRFYGEDPKKMQPDEFFGIFKEFTNSWEKCSADSKEVKMKQDRLEKQKKREQERRKRANSNAGSLKGKGVDGEDDKAILHSLLDKLKKDTLDVKVRRRTDRSRARQRSTSVSTNLQQSFSTQQPNVDPIYLRANKMLRTIQGENSTSLLADTGSPTIFDFGHSPHAMHTIDHKHGGRRRMSASVAIMPSFKPLYFDKEAVDSPMTATTPSTSLLDPSSVIPEETQSTMLGSRRRRRPLSAIIIPKASLSSQSQTSTNSTTPTATTTAAAAKPVRVRKTSKRPIFDHSLRVRTRRMSTR
jgi:uncharacterized membrane-anchored protein YhcB (DUF1043 family)